MGRKIQIEKDTLLSSGLDIVINSGYASLTAVNLARQANCSTQPIFWWFGNMESFKKELFKYALSRINERISFNEENPMASFMSVGMVYIDSAYDQPNLLRFIFSDNGELKSNGGIGNVYNAEKSTKMQSAIASQLEISIDSVADMVTKLIIFSDGLASAVLYGGFGLTKECAKKHIVEMGNCLMLTKGVSGDKVEKILSEIKI